MAPSFLHLSWYIILIVILVHLHCIQLSHYDIIYSFINLFLHTHKCTQGDFDDAQLIVKDAFADVKFRDEVKLGAINSINWGRILAQITYYFYSWLRVTDTLVAAGKPTVKINYAVPTGNFGDILAGFYAKRMGLPVDRLVVCANQNDVLHRYVCCDVYVCV